jgi:hypothetical protein
MAWELIVPDPPPPGCCELTALLVALGQIYGAAEAALTRREGELLSSMAIDEREPNAPWQTLRAVTKGGEVIEVPLLALISPRRHKVAEMTLEWTVAAVEVAAASGARVGLRRAQAGEEGAYPLKIVCGGAQRRLTVWLAERLMVEQVIAGGVGRRASRTIPQAEVFLLDEAAAAIVREELRLSPRRAPRRAAERAEARAEARAEERAEERVTGLSNEMVVETGHDPDSAGPRDDGGAVNLSDAPDLADTEAPAAEAPATEASGEDDESAAVHAGAAADERSDAVETALERGAERPAAQPAAPQPLEWRGPPRRRWAKKRRRPPR